mgnify:CR=1 FL=1
MIFYSSNNKLAPQLNNQWGVFNRVINYILNGGDQVTLNSIEFVEKNRIRIRVDNIPFVTSEVIEIKGSAMSEYNNKRFYVESVDVTANTAILFNSTISTYAPNDNSRNIKANNVKCGMTVKFSDEDRTVFKSANGMGYRIDDRDFSKLIFPPIDFNESWQKVCRVSMSSNYTTIDNTNSRIYPYNSSRPKENFTPNGDYIGENYFIYNQNQSTSLDNFSFDYLTNTVFPRGNMKYNIFANDRVMYIHIISENNPKFFHQYVIGEYNTPLNYKTAQIQSHCSKFPYNQEANSWSMCNRIDNNTNVGISACATSPKMCSILNSTLSDCHHKTLYDDSKGVARSFVHTPAFGINYTENGYRCGSGTTDIIAPLLGSTV